MTETPTQRLQRAVALRDAPGRTKGDWIASTKTNAILCADDGTSLAHAIRAEDRDFIAAVPSIVQLAVELGAEVERLEALFDQLRALRRDEGKCLRRYAVATANRYGERDAKELHEIANGLECGNPLGDCGCEGSCFTCGDCNRCKP